MHRMDVWRQACKHVAIQLYVYTSHDKVNSQNYLYIDTQADHLTWEQEWVVGALPQLRLHSRMTSAHIVDM